MKNGVSTDESPKSRLGDPPLPGAGREPVEGEARAAQHDPERGEAERDEQRREDRLRRRPRSAVQSTTSTKISQTWLASQTGPIAQSISARARLPRSPPPGEQRPEAGAEVGAAEHGVEGHADPEHAGDGVGGAHCGLPRPRARRGRSPGP